jgi:hypothetical protein
MQKNQVEERPPQAQIYRDFHQMFFFWSLHPLSGAIDIGILRSLYNQAPKKAVFYENKYGWRGLLGSCSGVRCRLIPALGRRGGNKGGLMPRDPQQELRWAFCGNRRAVSCRSRPFSKAEAFEQDNRGLAWR